MPTDPVFTNGTRKAGHLDPVDEPHVLAVGDDASSK